MPYIPADKMIKRIVVSMIYY